MTTEWWGGGFFFPRIVMTAALLASASGAHGGAGIATDLSFGAAQTIAQANAGPGIINIPQTLGSLAGNNLFHSFSRFNIDTGQTARFTTTTASIANVISRVTGGAASQINGLLQMRPVAGTPAFFLINPAGVVFGAGATIDVPGAFHVGTADYLKFANGDKFYADLGSASTLSSAAPEAFGFLATTRASVTVNEGARLATKTFQPISIVAGDVEIDNGRIVMDGGDVRVVALGQTTQEIGFSGTLPAATGNLDIVNGGQIVSYGNDSVDGGSTAVSAGNITIDNQGSYSNNGIFSIANSGVGNAGPVKVSASNITINGQGTGYYCGIFSQAWYDNGNAGSVDISATGSLSILNGGQISADTFSAGNAGTVNVSAGSITIDGQGSYVYIGQGYGYTGIFANANWGSAANAGSVDISTTGALSIVNGGAISADTYSAGNAGTVKVGAASILIDRLLSDSDTGIFSRAQLGRTGNAGVLEISTTGALDLVDGGAVSADTYSIGSGKGGAIQVSAKSLSINGQGSQISSSARLGTGNAGSIDLSATELLSINNGGVISSSASALGNAGNIAVKAGALLVDGYGNVGLTGIITDASYGYGNAGRVDVSVTNSLSILNGSVVSSSAYSAGSAGRIKISADTISIDDQRTSGTLTGVYSLGAGTAGNAGTVEVNARGALNIAHSGKISSSSFSAGNAGIVKVSADSITIDGEGGHGYTGIINTLSSGSSGQGGSIEVSAVSSLSLLNGGAISFDSRSSRDAGTAKVSAGTIAIERRGYISSESFASGNGGKVEVTAKGAMSIANGGYISSSALGSGKAGSVKVSADNITIDGGRANSAAIATGIFSDALGGTGGGGDIEVSGTGRLSIVNGGQIDSSTLTLGHAGSVAVSTNRLLVDGDSSAISAAAAAGSSGQTGLVSVTANDVTLSNGGQISIENRATVANPAILTPTSITVTAPRITILNSPNAITTQSAGNAAAGSIRINASESLYLDPSGITTSAFNGNGGAIDITTGLLWLDNAWITTSVTGPLNGNGGDIRIAANTLIMNTGFIQANTAAANASGGLVSLSVDNLVPSGNSLFLGGSTPRSFQAGAFGFNVIQAAAPTGVSGVVQLSSPVQDMSASLVGLDTRQVKSDQLAHRLCEHSGGSSLVPLGRGGLPPAASDFLSPGQIVGFVTGPTPELPRTKLGAVTFANCLAAL